MGAVSTLLLVRGLWPEAASLARSASGLECDEPQELKRALLALADNAGSDARLSEASVDAVLKRLLAASVGDGVAFGNAKSLVLTLEQAGLELDAESEHSIRVLDDGLTRPWATGSGGFGEGLRGALEPGACRHLAGALGRLGLDRGGIGGAAIRDAAGDDDLRPLRILVGMARSAGEAGTGLVHGRDLPLDGIGRWHRGVFRRH
ncbi:MAG: hypothetical protein K1X94_21405 [Sandaracinaceae bacterium]|nr:hypothetical protein [Sandaracinaceae bacterium]